MSLFSAPSSIDGIEKYLGSGMIRGIGPVYAKKMVKALSISAPACGVQRDGRDWRGGWVSTWVMRLAVERRASVPRPCLRNWRNLIASIPLPRPSRQSAPRSYPHERGAFLGRCAAGLFQSRE